MFFISHSSGDKARGRELAMGLSKAGHSAWFDERVIPLGADLAESVADAIRQSSVFVLIASKAALRASWVQKEIDLALDLGHEKIKVVTVMTGKVRVSDLPADLGTRVLLGADLTSHESARALSDLHSDGLDCPCSGRDRQVWLGISRDGQVEQHLDAVGIAGATVASVHLVTPDFRNLRDELRAAAQPALAWLEGRTSAQNWRNRILEMPTRHDRITSLIPVICGRYLESGCGDEFDRARGSEAIAYLVRRLYADLRLLHYLDNPSESETLDTEGVMEPPPEPFPGGLRAYISAGSFGTSVCCPSYVDYIDLPPMMLPGDTVVLPTDLGRMVGHVAASLTWARAADPRRRQPLPLAELGPALCDVKIGLA